MGRVLKAGVVGAGAFGGHHARKYASLPGVRLEAVFDPHIDRAEALAGALGARAVEELDRFLDAVDLVAIASPASSHAAIAMAALRRGKHVYVEKPLADRAEDAAVLVATAREAGLVLACGHQERAVFRAMGLLDLPEAPVRLEAVRRGTFASRNLDVSCVLDLMIHDIDLALAMALATTGGEPPAVRARGRAEPGPLTDEAHAELAFAGGMTAVLHASRIADARERTMRLVFPSGEMRIDLLTREVVNTTPFALNADFAETPEGRDPLGASIAAFVAAARGEAPRPLATGEEAARALAVALDVDREAALAPSLASTAKTRPAARRTRGSARAAR